MERSVSRFVIALGSARKCVVLIAAQLSGMAVAVAAVTVVSVATSG
jgi:hypothetical protein